MGVRGTRGFHRISLTALFAMLLLLAPQHAFAMRDAVVNVTVPTTVACRVQPDGTVIAPSEWEITSSSESVACDIGSLTTHNASPGFSYSVKDSKTSKKLNAFNGGVDTGGESMPLESGSSRKLTWSVGRLIPTPGDETLSNLSDKTVTLADVSFRITPRQLTGTIKLTGTPFYGEVLTYKRSNFSSILNLEFFWRCTHRDGTVEEIPVDPYTEPENSLIVTEKMSGAYIDVIAYQDGKDHYGVVASNRIGPITAGYAVYCEDDDSLEFFQDNLGIPKIGELSKTGKRVSAVYGGVNAEYPRRVDRFRPWYPIAADIKSVRVVDHVTTNYFRAWFYLFKNCTTMDIRNLDISQSPTMFWTFRSCNALTEILGIESLDVSNVTSFDSTFYDCRALSSLDLSSWDTSNATSMRYMFERCSSLAMLDVSHFDTSNVKDIERIFAKCSSLKDLDLNSWNISKVKSLRGVFQFMESAERIHISTWDVSHVSNFYWLFYSCRNLQEVEVTGWDMSSAVTIEGMFRDVSAPIIPVNDWNTGNLEDVSEAFFQCSGITELDLSRWDTSKLKVARNMFYRCFKLEALGIEGWDTPSLQNAEGMFVQCSRLKADLSAWDVSSVTVSTNFNELSSGVILPLAWQ